MDKLYRTILTDPPWPYRDKTLRFGLTKREGEASAQFHYPVMSLEQIASIAPPAEDNSYLFLWVTNPFLHEGLEIMQSWGFDYKTTVTWVKPSIRLGYYFRSRTEHLLFGTRGKPGRLKRNDIPNIIEYPVGRHSEKPTPTYDLIEMAVDGPYLEMFARAKRPGWDVWGNEVEGSINIKLCT